jgi:hypothetical protein
MQDGRHSNSNRIGFLDYHCDVEDRLNKSVCTEEDIPGFRMLIFGSYRRAFPSVLELPLRLSFRQTKPMQ